jgi:hypothetical protein
MCWAGKAGETADHRASEVRRTANVEGAEYDIYPRGLKEPYEIGAAGPA